MLNGYLTRRRAVALPAVIAALLGAALLLAYAGVPLAEAQSPPATPSSVSLSRADGTVTASWPAVSGATKYHITYSSDNRQSWSAASDSHTTNSITITNADNSKTYIVAVRAGNDNAQWSGWRNSAPAGPYTPDPAPTPTPDPDPPAAPANVTLTRADGTVTASWDAPGGASKYHITYSSNNRQSWSAASDSHAGTGITISDADNSKTYIVAVRAGNDAGWSGWRNSDPVGPYTPPQSPPAAPSSITIARADGTVTASWPAVSGATKYHVTYTSDNKQSWSAASDNHTDAAITINNADNAKTYIVAVRAGNAAGWSGWRNSDPAGPYTPPTLTATNETTNGATLTLSNYGGAWYYRAQGGAGASGRSVNCNGPVNGGQTTIGGLDPNTEYTVTAYVECGGAAIASSELVTAQNAALAHSNVGLSTATITRSGFSGTWYYNGSAPYTGCTSAGSGNSVSLANLSSGTSHTFTAYTSQYCYDDSTRGSTTFTTTGQPLQLIENNATNVVIGPYASWTGTWYRKTASGLPVNLSACTGPTTGSHEFTGLRAEGTVVLLMYDDSTCGNLVGAMAVKTPRAGLVVSSFDSTGANITIQRWKRGWRLRQESPSVGACITVATGTTTAVTGLTPGQQYTYKAYQDSGSGCTDSILGVTITFTVPELSVETGSTSAGLTLSHWSGQWWYRAIGIYSSSTGNLITYTGQPCRGPATGETTAVLNGLVGDYTWGFKAYGSYGACAADLSVANGGDDSGATGVLGAAPVKADTLGAPTLDASPVSGGVRLTLGNWGKSDGDWWYRANVMVPHANSQEHGANGCRGPVTGGKLQHDDTNLPALYGAGAYYRFNVYPVAGCHYSKVAAYATMGNVPAIDVFSVSNLSKTGNGQRGVTSEIGFGGRFVTGGAADGYRLTAVTINMSTPTGSPGDLTVAIHGDSNGKPGTLQTTLSGSKRPGRADHTFTCTSGCALAANAKYYVVLSTSGASVANAYHWNFTNSLLEDRTPAGNGWSIGDKAYQRISGFWSDSDGPVKFKVTATEPPTATLAASNVKAWSATLTISGHPGSWYYKANAAPHASCTGPVHATSEALTGLTASTSSYVYTAYSDSSCKNVVATAASFSTLDPPPARIDSVTLSRGSGTLILSWTAPADNGFTITRYDVEYKTSSATTWTSGGTSTTTSKTVSSVTNATSYDVRVRAVNANGNAEWRESSVGALGNPGTPTGLTKTGWVLSWTAPSNTGNAAITRYEVECRRGLNKGTVHSTTGATSVTLTHSWCKQYSIHGNHARVRAQNAGNLYGPWSGWLQLQ